VRSTRAAATAAFRAASNSLPGFHVGSAGSFAKRIPAMSRSARVLDRAGESQSFEYSSEGWW